MSEETIEILEDGLEEDRVEAKIYELGYHIVPLIAEENLGAEVDRLKGIIEKKGGTVIEDEWPKLRPLTYGIKKQVEGMRHTFTNAYFAWIKFEAAPSEAQAINEEVRTIENVLRFLLIHTVRVIPTRRMDPAKIPAESEEKSEPASAAPVEAGISVEVLDKTIDELVVE
jgi:small subunit ribosomal protein S6